MMNIRLKEASIATPQNPQVRMSSCPQPELHLSSVVSRQRERLTQLLYGPMQKIATSYGQIAGEQEKPWTYRSTVDAFLVNVFASVPFAKYLYVMNTSGVQISSSVSREGLLPEHFGRDRSDRPYMREALSTASFLDRNRESCYQQWAYLENNMQAVDFLLCDAYISQNALRPSLTAVFFLRDTEGSHIGFLGADFALRELPLMPDMYTEIRKPRYFVAAVPAGQEHQTSRLDREIDTIVSILDELITFHGVYHVKLHFNSSQAVIWQVDDPYRYRLLSILDLLVWLTRGILIQRVHRSNNLSFDPY
ncbi:MAG: hypothetical protein ACYCY1_12020 [Sulfuriferula sp.]